MTIDVEEYITRFRIPVSVQTVGSAPEGYYAGAATLDPPTVTISGPKSMVDKIVRAEVVLELNNLPQREGTIRKALAYTLLDENNNAIESDLLEVTSESVLLDSVIVEQTMYAMKTLELSQTGLIQGTPKEGYEIKNQHDAGEHHGGGLVKRDDGNRRAVYGCNHRRVRLVRFGQAARPIEQRARTEIRQRHLRQRDD